MSRWYQITVGSPPSAPSWPPTLGTYDPDASTTGVRPDQTLTDNHGSSGHLTINGSGAGLTTISNQNFLCFVTANASAGDIKFINCNFHGYSDATTNTALLKTSGTSTVHSVVIEDSTFCPDYPSYWLDAIMGAGFSAKRCNVYSTVDGFGVQGDHVLIQACYVHDHSYFSPDPNHSDNHTHNDSTQSAYGMDLEICYNNFEAKTSTDQGNTAIFIKHESGYSATGSVNIHDNLLDGGSACVHCFQTSADHAAGLNEITGLSITNNRFGAYAGTSGQTIYVASCIPNVVISGNTMDANGSAAPIVRFSS